MRPGAHAARATPSCAVQNDEPDVPYRFRTSTIPASAPAVSSSIRRRSEVGGADGMNRTTKFATGTDDAVGIGKPFAFRRRIGSQHGGDPRGLAMAAELHTLHR